MNVANVKHFDIANGPGIRTSLFLSGCPFHCEGCFNSITWDYNYGEVLSGEIKQNIIESLKNESVTGFSLLGGEPFERENDGDYYVIINLIQLIKRDTNCSSFWVWSGHTFEELIKNEHWYHLLKEFDVLVDGQFIQEKKDLRLPYCGSTNQRVIDVQKSLKEEKVVLWEN